MQGKSLFIVCLMAMPFTIWGNYYGSQVNYKYSEKDNRMYVTAKYWRLCNDIADRLVDNITVEGPGCGTFTIPLVTTITDISLHKNKYPTQACNLPNGNNQVRGLEEFVGRGSFALDTLPFKNWVSNGCCKVYLSASFFFRPQGVTTGVSGLIYNYAMIDMCNLKATNITELKSPDYLQPMFTEKLQLNSTVYIDFGAFGDGKDSVDYQLVAALGNSRTNTVPPSAPLDVKYPMMGYCIGNSWPCTPIPQANPQIGFYFDRTTSLMAFTPTQINEQGVAVIQANQFISDTNGKKVLVGQNRREFTMTVESSSVNNTPEILGSFDYVLFEGDSLEGEIRSRDQRVVAPPPGILQIADTTFFILKSNSPDVKLWIKDSSQRERVGKFKLVADSSHHCISPIVISAVVHDDDSLIPARSMRSCRIHIVERLNIGVKVESQSCGNVKFTLTGDSLDLLKYAIAKKVNLWVSKGSWGRRTRLDSNWTLNLPEQGTYTYRLMGGDDRTFGYDISDTFSYANDLIRITDPLLNPSFCSGYPSEFTPQVINQTSDSAFYEWYADTLPALLSTDTTLLFSKNYRYVTLKVMAGGCSAQKRYYIDSFIQGVPKKVNLAFCQGSKDMVDLVKLKRSNLPTDLFQAHARNHSLPYAPLIGGDSFLDVQEAFRVNDSSKIILELNQTRINSSCIYIDTVIVDLIRPRIELTDSQICAKSGWFHLAQLTNDKDFSDTAQGNFALYKNGMIQLGYIQQDSLATNQLDSGDYQIVYQYRQGACVFKDTCSVRVNLAPRALTLFQLKDSLCFNPMGYNLKRFLDADSGYKLTHINANPYSGSQDIYLKDTLFRTDVSEGLFTIEHIQTNIFACEAKQDFELEVYDLPRFSLGPDLNANSFTNINLYAPLGMQSYDWNLKNHSQRVFSYNAGALGFDSGQHLIICKVVDRKGCTFLDTVLINYSTGLKKVIEIPLQVYPNPSEGVFHIKGDISIEQVEVYNGIGMKVKVLSIPRSQKSLIINLESQPSGTYIVSIATGQGVFFVKLVLQSD